MGMKRAGTILLVEDEGMLRGLVAQFLRGEGYEVVEAADGLQGVERFSRLGPFDLVLLDLNLPFLCGTEVCRRVKEHEPRQSIIICSAAILDDHLAAFERMGIDQYLTKPYHPAELLCRVNLEIDRARERQAGGVRPKSEQEQWRAHRAHGPVGPSHALSKKPVID